MTNQPFKEKSETEMISYDQAYDLVRAEVDKTLSASPFVVREYMKHLALSTGKNIRAAFSFNLCHGAGGSNQK